MRCRHSHSHLVIKAAPLPHYRHDRNPPTVTAASGAVAVYLRKRRDGAPPLQSRAARSREHCNRSGDGCACAEMRVDSARLVAAVALLASLLGVPRGAAGAASKCSIVVRNRNDTIGSVAEDADKSNSSLCCKPCPSNSTCTEENTCTCAQGYQLRGRKSIICQPVCSPACDRNTEQCAAPDRCDCKKGYAREGGAGGAGRCVPVCSPGCSAGAFCYRPGVCQCLRGYVDAGGVCEAHGKKRMAKYQYFFRNENAIINFLSGWYSTNH
ncbi:Uncharacterized protein GBIM_12702, partial [Gryllus bimaculatus]